MSSCRSAKAPEAARVCLGVIASAHGVRGQVKSKTFTADPAAVADYGPVVDDSGRRRFALALIGRVKGGVIAKLDGIEDRDTAQALKGTMLYVDRAALPKPERDEFYHADLIGLGVELEDGTTLGQVKAVHELGAGDLLEVALPGRRSVMVPFNKEVVPEVDLDGGRLVLKPPPGLLEEAER